MKNTPIISNWTRRFSVAGITLAALPVLAADSDNLANSDAIAAPTEAPTTVKTPPTSVSTGLAEQFNTGVANGGTMSITRFNAGVAVPVRLTDDLVLNTSFRFALDSYDFRSLAGGWFGAWHNIDTYTLSSVLCGRIDDKWSVYGGGLLRESGETGAEFKKGITGARVAGQIPLPTRIERYTVQRSPHSDKKSQETFEQRTHKRLIDILEPTAKTVDELKKLNLPAGVDITIKI